MKGDNIVITGAPGSGKGTQAVRLSSALGCVHLSTGEMLRAEVDAGTSVGKVISEIVATGSLVPDELVDELIFPHIEAAASDYGYVLDGYPRTVAQTVALLSADFAPNHVIGLNVSHAVLIERIMQRGRLAGRTDDNHETARNRLTVFAEQTAPAWELFHEKGLLRLVDGERDPEHVFDEILDRLR